MALVDFPKLARERYGIWNLEILGQHFPSTEPDYLKTFREAVTRAAAVVVNIPTSVGASFYDPDAAKRALAVANSKKHAGALTKRGLGRSYEGPQLVRF